MLPQFKEFQYQYMLNKMRKVYVKFGSPLDNEDHIYVYEGLLEDNVVKLILPTASYSICQTIANDMEQPAYIVEGTRIGQANNGQPALREYKVVSKLTLDKYKECYVCGEIKEIPVEPIVEVKEKEPEEIPLYEESTPKFIKFMVDTGYFIKTGKISNGKINKNEFINGKINRDKNDLQSFSKK